MYHLYIKKVNDDYRVYGYCDSKKETDNLVKYWNFLYPERYIEPVE